jgi:hypothetical protein
MELQYSIERKSLKINAQTLLRSNWQQHTQTHLNNYLSLPLRRLPVGNVLPTMTAMVHCLGRYQLLSATAQSFSSSLQHA